jgi:hypothetical protein
VPPFLTMCCAGVQQQARLKALGRHNRHVTASTPNDALVPPFPTIWCAGTQQRARLKALDRLLTDANSILVATDVAARGLDVKDVRCAELALSLHTVWLKILVLNKPRLNLGP